MAGSPAGISFQGSADDRLRLHRRLRGRSGSHGRDRASTPGRLRCRACVPVGRDSVPRDHTAELDARRPAAKRRGRRHPRPELRVRRQCSRSQRRVLALGGEPAPSGSSNRRSRTSAAKRLLLALTPAFATHNHARPHNRLVRAFSQSKASSASSSRSRTRAGRPARSTLASRQQRSARGLLYLTWRLRGALSCETAMGSVATDPIAGGRRSYPLWPQPRWSLGPSAPVARDRAVARSSTIACTRMVP
jgi:hypothetical protein